MTRGPKPVGRTSWPQSGQQGWGRWSKKSLTTSAGNKARSCLGWPGWPPGGRGVCSAEEDLGGLTMSEEGGLEEVEESLRAEASCSCRRATVACRASIWTHCASSCSCKRWHPGQGLAASSAILWVYDLCASSPIPGRERSRPEQRPQGGGSDPRRLLAGGVRAETEPADEAGCREGLARP